MPIQVVKDPQTGEERQVYVAPKGMASEPKPVAKPAAPPQPAQDGGGFQVTDLLPVAAGKGLFTGLQTLQRTGDLNKAWAAGTRDVTKSLEGNRAVQTVSRTAYNAVTGLAQETNDAIQETFGGKATTKANPNTNFLGVLPPLQRAKSSGPAEDLVTGIAQAALAWIPVARGVNLAAKGLSLVPGVTAVGSAAGTGIKALKATKAAQAVAKLPGAVPVGRAVLSNTVTKAAVTGALVDYTAFDQHEGRLYDLVDQLQQKVTGTPLEVPFLDYLKSDPNDVGATGRLKNVMEGALIGTGLELGLRAFKTARAAYQLRNASPEARPQAIQEVAKESEALSREVTRQANTVPDDFPVEGIEGPVPPRYSEVAEVNPLEIVEPPRRGRKPKEEAAPLAQPGEFDPVAAGVIDVRRDPATGTPVVVDGRKRLQLAKDSGVDAVLVREVPPEPQRVEPTLRTEPTVLPDAEGRVEPTMASTGSKTPLSQQLRGNLQNLGGSLADATRTMEGIMQRQGDSLARRVADNDQALADVPQALPPAAAAPVARAADEVTAPVTEVAATAPKYTPEQQAETKALMDRALAVLPPERRAAVQAELEARGLASEEVPPIKQYADLPVEVQQAMAKEVIEDIRRVAGDDVAIRFNQAFELIQRPREHGGGDKKILAGGRYDPFEDIIDLNGWALGTPTSTKKQTAFHEAFHRVQFNFLTEQELKALNSFWSQLKLAVADGSKSDRKLIEQQAVAFQQYAYARKEGIDPVAFMAGATEQELKDGGLATEVATKGLGVLDTLLDFIEKSNNFIRGRGWTSIKSIFEQAYSGELAQTRQDLGSAYEEPSVPGRKPISYPRTDILDSIRDMDAVPLGGSDNPYRGRLFSEADEAPVRANSGDQEWAQRLVDQIQANRQAIEDGSMTVDDLLQNNVLKVESPSGATTYVPDAPPEMVEAYRAHSDLISRVDATGIPMMSEERVAYDTANWLERNNHSSKAVLENLLRISGPLSNYQDNLVALRAAMLLADHTNYQAGIAANKWLNSAVDESANLGQRAAELVSAAAAADRANRAVESVTRPLGQLMRSTQFERPTPGGLPFDGTPSSGRNIAEELEQTMVREAEIPVSETVGRPVSGELEEAIRTGDFTSPQVAEELDALALNVAQGSVTNGYSSGFWSNFNKSAGIGARGLMMYRSSQLLSSGITFWGNIINSAMRSVELPFTQAVGALVQGAPVRASRSLMIYGQYVSNLMGAFRMGVESFKVGRGLFDLDRSQVDFLEKLASQDAQGQLLSAPQKGEWDLNTMPWVNVQDKSNWAVAQKRLWQSLNLSTRLQVSADSAFKSLVGQSFEYVRNIQPGLDNAVRLGMDGNSKEAWDFAAKYSQAAVDRSLRDITINGKTILDAVMESPHAQTATRWATFTDDVWAQMQPRTSTYGMKLAEAKGLTGDAAEKFAQDYVTNGPRIFGQGMDDIPAFARTFSLMPRIWQMGLDSPMAPLFALIQPFNRTPGDIVKSVARKTPLAPLVDTWWRDVFSEDAMTRDRAVGDIATGAAAIAVASLAMTHGRIQFTGGGPTEPGSRRKWNEQDGKQPFSFRIRLGEDETGNSVFSDWVSMRALDPYSSLFGALADYQELANKLPTEARERLGSALVMDLVTAVAAGQLSKSYYTGFMEVVEMAMGLGEVDAVPNKRHPVSRYVQRLIASFVPGSSALRAGRRIDDPTAREVPASNDESFAMRFFDETLNEIRNAVPGWSDVLPPRRNWITGEPIVLSGIWGDQFLPPESPWLSTLLQYSPASPFQVKSSQGDPVLLEMGRLSGRGAGFIGPRPTDFTDGGKVKANRLDPYEHEQYVLAISRTPDEFGRTLVQALEEEIKSDLYQESPQGPPSEQVVSLRAAALNQVTAKFMKLGREAFLDSPAGKRLMDNTNWAEGANRDVQFRLKYGQEIDPAAFVEALR